MKTKIGDFESWFRSCGWEKTDKEHFDTGMAVIELAKLAVINSDYARAYELKLKDTSGENFTLREALKEILGRCQITGMSFESQMHCNTETARKALLRIRQPDALAEPSNADIRNGDRGDAACK